MPLVLYTLELVSDHSLIYVVRKSMLPKSNPRVREIRDYQHFDAELLVEDLIVPNALP